MVCIWYRKPKRENKTFILAWCVITSLHTYIVYIIHDIIYLSIYLTYRYTYRCKCNQNICLSNYCVYKLCFILMHIKWNILYWNKFCYTNRFFCHNIRKLSCGTPHVRFNDRLLYVPNTKYGIQIHIILYTYIVKVFFHLIEIQICQSLFFKCC